MTKIKNFRITLRSREIARLLKMQQRLQLTPALEASIERAVKECKPLIQPAALFVTQTRAAAVKSMPVTLPEKAVAASFLAVTIGPALQRAREEAASGVDAIQSGLLAAVEQEAVQQAIQFVSRLVYDQAKEEECELTPAADVDAAHVAPLATLLGIQRIGIPVDAASPALPSGARLVWMSWMPVAKVSTKRSSSTSRSEKAVVS